MPNPLLRDRQLDTDVYRPNLLQNGGFEVWPGSGSQAGVVGSQVRIADGSWFVITGTGGAVTFTRQAGNGSPSAAGVSYVHGSVATQLIQVIPIFAQLAGRQVTFAVDVFSNTTNTARVLVWDGVSALGYSAYHPGGSVWQRMSSTCTVAANATQLWVYVEFGNSMGGAIDNATLVLGGTPGDYAPGVSYPDLVPNARLGSDVARANLLTNGGFEVWQRGNGPFTGGNAGPDRWGFNVAAGCTLSASKAPISGSLAAPPVGMSTAACSLTFTPSGGNPYGGLTQNVGNDPVSTYNTIGTFVAFSAWVLCSSPVPAVHLEINGIGSGIYRSDTHLGDGTWRWLTVVAPISAYANVGIFMTGSGQAWIDNCMAVVGTVPAAYVPLHPADEAARCMRYCERVGTEYFEPIGVGTFDSLGAVVNISYKVAKPVTPSLTYTSNQFSYYNAASQTWYTPSTVGAVVGGSPKAGVVLRLQGGTYGAVASATVVVAGGGSTAMLVEANP